MFEFATGFVDLKRNGYFVQFEFPRKYLVDFIVALVDQTTSEEYDKLLSEMGLV